VKPAVSWGFIQWARSIATAAWCAPDRWGGNCGALPSRRYDRKEVFDIKHPREIDRRCAAACLLPCGLLAGTARREAPVKNDLPEKLLVVASGHAANLEYEFVLSRAPEGRPVTSVFPHSIQNPHEPLL